MSHNLGMNADRESDGRVLPAKCPNKGGRSSLAEGMEGRRPTKENTEQLAASQMQSWENASAGMRRVRGVANRYLHRYPHLRFDVKTLRYEPDALVSARPAPCGGRRVTGVPTATCAGIKPAWRSG
jgi:hypothetical protein